MYKSLLIPALLSATALAGESGWTASTTAAAYGSEPTSCEAQGIQSGMGKQLVTVVHVSNEDGSQLRYFPENIVAPVGSIVQFQFHPRNHTVTESSFDEPCKPLAANLATPERPGQRSGFVPVTPADTDLKVYNMLVNDTRPIWLYCAQGNHCAQGMSIVINEPKDNPERTLAKYKEAAALVQMAPAAPAGPAAPSGDAAATPSTTPGQAQAASGTGSGKPAVYTGAAAPSASRIQYASFGGLAVAALAALL